MSLKVEIASVQGEIMRHGSMIVIPATRSYGDPHDHQHPRHLHPAGAPTLAAAPHEAASASALHLVPNPSTFQFKQLNSAQLQMTPARGDANSIPLVDICRWSGRVRGALEQT